MLGGVVGLGVVVARDAHRHRQRVDLHVAVSRDGEGHGEVAVVVLELGRGEAHVGRADVGAFRAGRLPALQAEVGRVAAHLVERAGGRGGVARHLVLGGVVGLGVVVARDVHRHRQRVDLHVAVRLNGEGHGEVVVVVLELGRGEAHVGRADVGAFRAGRLPALQAEVGRVAAHLVERAGGRGGVARHLVLGGVIGLGVIVAGDVHRHRQRVNHHLHGLFHRIAALRAGGRHRHLVGAGGRGGAAERQRASPFGAGHPVGFVSQGNRGVRVSDVDGLHVLSIRLGLRELVNIQCGHGLQHDRALLGVCAAFILVGGHDCVGAFFGRCTAEGSGRCFTERQSGR